MALRAKGAEMPSSLAVFIVGIVNSLRTQPLGGGGRAENEEHGRKRRQRHDRGSGKAVRGARFGGDAAEIAHVRAAVGSGVAVERLAPQALIRKAETVAQARLWREVADDRDRRIALRAASEKRQHRLGVVVDHDPAKAVRLAIAGVERGRLAIEPVEIADPRLDALMGPMVEQPPGKGLRSVPLAGLPELLPHEQELLAGMAPHEPVEGARVGE